MQGWGLDKPICAVCVLCVREGFFPPTFTSSILFAMFTGVCGLPEKLHVSLTLVHHSNVLCMIVKLTYCFCLFVSVLIPILLTLYSVGQLITSMEWTICEWYGQWMESRKGIIHKHIFPMSMSKDLFIIKLIKVVLAHILLSLLYITEKVYTPSHLLLK